MNVFYFSSRVSAHFFFFDHLQENSKFDIVHSTHTDSHKQTGTHRIWSTDYGKKEKERKQYKGQMCPYCCERSPFSRTLNIWFFFHKMCRWIVILVWATSLFPSAGGNHDRLTQRAIWDQVRFSSHVWWKTDHLKEPNEGGQYCYKRIQFKQNVLLWG